MILTVLIMILIGGGILAWIAGKWNNNFPRIIALTALSINLIITVSVFLQSSSEPGEWIVNYTSTWIPHFGISLHLALDGLSLLMLLLSFFLGIVSVLVSWNEIRESSGFFHFNILWIIAGITGVFLSLDLFLFYFFWELMILPMFFLINIWGHENRIYASYKFFIYTQAGGLAMFIAILVLYFIHGRTTGTYTFNFPDLIGTNMNSSTAFLLMLGFLAAFLIKLPAVPLHNWLPDAHTEAPTAGSVILAGLLLKTGAYGLIRFVIPLFPGASIDFAPYGMTIGVIGILYGAKLAFAQTDLKRLVAYTSVSHMGFILLGVYAFNEIAYQGVIIQMIAHAISTGALFILVGQLQERIHTRDISKMGGLWKQVPVMGVIGLIFSMASLGLPGMGNFVAEFLTLLGTFKSSIFMASLASLGLIGATLYSLRIMQKVFYGKERVIKNLIDLNLHEKMISGVLVILIFYLGLFPSGVINVIKPAVLKSLKEYSVNKQDHQNKQELSVNPEFADDKPNP
jgi:NADH-quinone oxidoreductase subunit M